MVDYHPGMSMIWGDSVLNQWNPEITATIGAMAPEEIFKYYAKSIGIGGIAWQVSSALSSLGASSRVP